MQWKQVGMKAQLTETLFVQKAGEPDPIDRSISEHLYMMPRNDHAQSLKSEGTGDSP